MSEDVVGTAIAEIIKKVQIEDGDILIVKTASDEVMDQLSRAIDQLHDDLGKDIRYLLIEQEVADLLFEADEEFMRKYGWQKIK